MSLHSENAVLQSVIPTEKLREYIAYCRANCHPTISDAAGQRLVDTYVRMRSAGMSRKVRPYFWSTCIHISLSLSLSLSLMLSQVTKRIYL